MEFGAAYKFNSKNRRRDHSSTGQGESGPGVPGTGVGRGQHVGTTSGWSAAGSIIGTGSPQPAVSSSSAGPAPLDSSSSTGPAPAPFVPSDGPSLPLSAFVLLSSASSWSPRSGFGAVQCGSNVLVLGGFSVSAPFWLNEVHALNPEAGSWSQLTSAPWTGRDQFAVSRINETAIVLTGGAAESGLQNDVWAASCAAGASAPQWILLSASAPFSPRFAHATVMWGTQLVLLGGSASSTLAGLNDVWTLDLSAASAQWVAQPLAPWSARQSFAAAVLGSALIVSGGVSLQPPFTPAYLNDVWLLRSAGSDWSASAWTELAPASFSPRSYLASAVLNGTEWFVCGGQSFNDSVAPDPYYRFNGSWSAQPMPAWGARQGSRLVELTVSAGLRSTADSATYPRALLLIGGSDSEAVPHSDVWAAYLGPVPAAASSGGSSGFRWSSAGGVFAILLIISAILPAVCLRSYAAFTLKHCADDNKRLGGRFSKDDCSQLCVAKQWQHEGVGLTQSSPVPVPSPSSDAAIDAASAGGLPAGFRPSLMPSAVNYRFAAVSEEMVFERINPEEAAEAEEEEAAEAEEAPAAVVAAEEATAAAVGVDSALEDVLSVLGQFHSLESPDSNIPDVDPSLDPLCQALLHDKAADDSDIESADAAVPYLLQMAARFCTFLDACVAYTHNHDCTKLYTESMEEASHYAWLRVRTSFQTWKLSAVAESMPHRPWFDTFRHYVYGFSLPSTDVPNNCSLVKIGYTHSKMEFYAAYKYKRDPTSLPCSLQQYKKDTASEQSMLVDESISRVLTVAEQFDYWWNREGRLLFLFGPFPTKIAAVHAEHHIRSLSGAFMDPDVIARRMSGDAKSGKGDFVNVPDGRREKLEELNAHCGRSRMQVAREVLETLTQIITK